MKTYCCEKLCSGDCCAPLRWAVKNVHCYLDNDGRLIRDLLGGAIWLAMQSDEIQAQHAAILAITDPAKLAELLVLGGNARGADTVEAWTSWGELVGISVNGYTPRLLAMPEARALLAYIMITIADDVSKWQCEQLLIRGVQ